MSERAAARMTRWHAETLDEVRSAVASEAVVVVGMGWNPHVRKARKLLEAAGISYKYLGYGNYLVGWKPRLAIKLWSGWPTFPQVYVRGRLIGGATDLDAALQDGSLRAELSS
jgi:glutaredoxin-related protein